VYLHIANLHLRAMEDWLGILKGLNKCWNFITVLYLSWWCSDVTCTTVCRNPITDMNEKSEPLSIDLRVNKILFKEGRSVGYIQRISLKICKNRWLIRPHTNIMLSAVCCMMYILQTGWWLFIHPQETGCHNMDRFFFFCFKIIGDRYHRKWESIKVSVPVTIARPRLNDPSPRLRVT
jgi:hypothetical protein